MERARKILWDHKIYNFRGDDRGAKALVLDSAPLPFKVSILFQEKDFWASCTCFQGGLCSHLLALLLKAEEEGLPSLDPFYPLDLPKDSQRLDPTSPFHQEDEVGKELPLFMDLGQQEFYTPGEAPRYNLVFFLSRQESGIGIYPGLIRLREGAPRGSIRPYNSKRSVNSLLPAQKKLLQKIGPEGAPAETCLGELLKIPELFSSKGKRLIVQPSEHLEISFAFLTLLADNRPLYTPLFHFKTSQGKIYTFDRTNLPFCSSQGLLALTEEVFLYEKKGGLPSPLITLLFSKEQGLLEADILGVLRLSQVIQGPRVHFVSRYPKVFIERVKPRGVLKLRGRKKKTEGFFFFTYGEEIIPYHSSQGYAVLEKGENKLSLSYRDRGAEEKLVRSLVGELQEHLSFEKGYYAKILSGDQGGDLRLGLPVEEFLESYGGILQDRGVELYLEERRLKKGGGLCFQVRGTRDWLEVDALVEDPTSKVPQRIFLDSYFRDLGLIGTKDSYIHLSREDLEKIKELCLQGMGEDGHLETPGANFAVVKRVHSQVLDPGEAPLGELLTQGEGLTTKGAYEEPPKELKAELRPYQREGYTWLLALHRRGLQGCLADDMGLGKTLQTLGLLQKLKEEGNLSTSLLIAPVVTLANWEREVERFTPSLRLLSYQGARRSLEDHGNYDIILVSYHTLRKDQNFFQPLSFDYIILDEAHYIKNSASQMFQACCSLQSRHRLSLTGTPIENNTMELWSQFSFLAPTLLGGRQEFYHRFARPIEREGNKEALEALRERVRPFMLRRRKEEVLTELPEKETITFYSPMLPIQGKIYNQYRDLYRAKVKGLLQDKGLAGAKIEILQCILHLRQLAIHPPMMKHPETLGVESSKMQALKGLLDEILAENHKVLIFSQFRATLEAIREHCEMEHWQYSCLTGETRNREEQIYRFQEKEEVRIFLLSLKAGGVGINLTAADYVILFDPWWNPAIENQAIDRAHRMGQTRRVISYKMITRDTIEEKILQMQQEKTELMEGILEGEQTFLPSLDEEEIIGLFE